jgi:hypothetical protein
MRKLIIALTALLAMAVTTNAKVVKIMLSDGTQRVYTSSEISAIDFNDDGTLTVTTYDGQMQIFDAELEILEIGDEATITAVYPDTLSFIIDVDGIPVDLHTNRNITKVNYVYPSTDPFGNSITLSGTMLIPEEIWSGQVKSEGILMVNHYTKFHRDEAPTISNGEIENMLLANPLYPNYIIVESDFYGFGATVRFPQAFMQGLNNARASLDGLLYARDLLEQMGLDYGPLCFNIGYSSGGFDALAAQKLRDMEYADRISFDKTFAGGSPSDVEEAYRQYVITDSTAYNCVPMLLFVATNEIQQLGLDYADVFQPYICNRIGELVLSKNYSSWPICDSIGRDKKIHEILAEPYCNLESEESKAMQEVLRSFNMTNDDWTPDLSQRIYLFHSRGDDYVPIQSARPMVRFLRDKGFEPSIIPGRTNLQTNFVVTTMGHLTGTLIYYIQTLAAIKAWPMMYIGGQLNPLYAYIVNEDVDIVATMRHLDAMGIDCRAIINGIMSYITGGGEDTTINAALIITLLSEQMAKVGLTMQDLYEMSEDSGLDIQKFIIDLVAYFSELPDNGELNDEGAQPGDNPTEAARRSAHLLKAIDDSKTPADRYAQQLRDWLTATASQ